MKTLAPAVSALQAVRHLMHDVHRHRLMERRMPLYFLVIQVALCDKERQAHNYLYKMVPKPNTNLPDDIWTPKIATSAEINPSPVRDLS